MFDYDMNDVPVCPYCNHLMEDLFEAGVSERDGGVNTVFCSNCDKKYEVETSVILKFTTRGFCDVHKLRLSFKLENGAARYTCVDCKREFYNWQLEKMPKEKYEIVIGGKDERQI
jgi:DNA-directed RNA polymerase subunit RPC12/RpoP